jgi:hypothetical protein
MFQGKPRSWKIKEDCIGVHQLSGSRFHHEAIVTNVPMRNLYHAVKPMTTYLSLQLIHTLAVKFKTPYLTRRGTRARWFALDLRDLLGIAAENSPCCGVSKGPAPCACLDDDCSWASA